MNQIQQVSTTIDDRANAEAIAQQVVAEQLAACVQIDGPIMSIYRWKDDVETSQEWRLTMKTTSEVVPRLVARVESLHSYDVPEILTTRVDDVSAAYGRWLCDQIVGS